MIDLQNNKSWNQRLECEESWTLTSLVSMSWSVWDYRKYLEVFVGPAVQDHQPVVV